MVPHLLTVSTANSIAISLRITLDQRLTHIFACYSYIMFHFYQYLQYSDTNEEPARRLVDRWVGRQIKQGYVEWR